MTSNAAGAYQSIYFVEGGVAAEVAELYAAAFVRQPDLPGLEYWLNQYANGVSLATIAQDFATSTEFQSKFGVSAPDHGGPNDQAYVTQLYENVLGRPPDTAGLDFWLENLASGALSRSDTLIFFAVSPENQADVSASDGGWLVNMSQGGYGLLAAQTVISQGVTNSYIDTALIDPTTIPAGGVTVGNVELLAGSAPTLVLNSSAPSETVILSSAVPNITAANSGDAITEVGNNFSSVVNFTNGSNNSFSIATGAAGNTVEILGGSNNTIYGFAPGGGNHVMAGNTTIAADVSLHNGATTQIAGSSLTFSNSVANVVVTGSMGSGSTTSVLAAINASYAVADKPGEYITFIGQDSAGNTEVWLFGSTAGAANGLIPASSNAGSADLNNNHQVDANEIIHVTTLIGVTVSALAASDIA
jgi:hypothetical protein